ncbi:hypothetical protein ABEB22_07930 [Thioclava sp. 'Guangxiensis']|uniref:hypothetical protein n=1 Tax=Thioclava sp. 'Guangxiensis' TaxID=3149044 RepID=UPI003877BB68
MSLSHYLSSLVSSVHKLWLNQQKSGNAAQGFAAQMDESDAPASLSGATPEQLTKGVTPAQTSVKTETAQVGLVVEPALSGMLTTADKGSATRPRSGTPSYTAPVVVPVEQVANRTETPSGANTNTAQNIFTIGLDGNLQDRTTSLRAQSAYQSLNATGPVWSVGGDTATSPPRTGGGTQIFDANGLVSTHLAMSF